MRLLESSQSCTLCLHGLPLNVLMCVLLRENCEFTSSYKKFHRGSPLLLILRLPASCRTMIGVAGRTPTQKPKDKTSVSASCQPVRSATFKRWKHQPILICVTCLFICRKISIPQLLWVQRLKPATSALWRIKQEGLELKASLSYLKQPTLVSDAYRM